MLAIVYDLLLLLSVAVPPVVFCYLLYLGLKISREDESQPAEVRRTNPKSRQLRRGNLQDRETARN